MKLEKCALCGKKGVSWTGQEAHCQTRGCPMNLVGETAVRHWNLLQRAIRKARRPGRVLKVGWAPLGKWAICQFKRDDKVCRMCPHYTGCRRVEVREAPKRRDGR